MSKSNLRIKSGRIITPVEERLTDLWIAGGKILGFASSLEQLRRHSHPVLLSSILPDHLEEADFDIYDAAGLYVTPGLIDLQMNGGPACDFWLDPTQEQVKAIRRELAGRGVTSFLPTLITDDLAHMRKNIDFLESQGARRSPLARADGMARMLGLHLEGPCLSPKRPGVHPSQYIKPFTIDVVKQLISGPIALMTAACEGDIDGKSIILLKDNGIAVSLGHSDATFAEASRAFDRGVSLMTHTFNALPPLHHREPGAVGAALLRDDVVCCLIADGLHLSPQACQLILKLKGFSRALLVTDRASVGTSQGGLVGSSITLDQAVQNMCRWGLASFSQAIAMATINPARAIGMEQEIGSLEPGLPADIAFFDMDSLEVKDVAIDGQLIKYEDKKRVGRGKAAAK